MILANHGIIASSGASTPLLLDTYSGASAAYSLRKISASYTGYAVRIRRNTDNASQDIGFVNNDLDTASITSFLGSNSGFVSIWYDQSGNSNNAAQVSLSQQPLIYNSGSLITVNSKPSIYLNGGYTLGLTNTVTLGDFTTLWVSKKDNKSDDYYIMLNKEFAGGNFFGEPLSSGVPFANSTSNFINTTLGNTSASNTENTQHLAYLNRRNSTQAVGQFNNSNNSYNNSVNSVTVPINFIANYGTFSYKGNVQEILIYSSDKSNDSSGISSDINTYYSIY
jgi:hypothetical protein